MESFTSKDDRGNSFSVWPKGNMTDDVRIIVSGAPKVGGWRTSEGVSLSDAEIDRLHEFLGKLIEERKNNSPEAKRRELLARNIFGKSFEELGEFNKAKVDTLIRELQGLPE